MHIVAFASGGTPRDHPNFDAELTTLYGLRQAQGQGIGRALWVLASNPTRACYAHLGGREDGEKTRTLPGGGGLREVRMVWDDLARLR